MPPRLPFRTSHAGLVVAATVLLAGCSGPPPPAPEPTGADLERAWRIAVGSDPLNQTIAELYAQALNARDTPAVVVENPDDEATALAVALGEENAEHAEEDSADQRYEIVLARTRALAEALDPAGYAELTGQPSQDLGPAAAPGDLSELIEAQLSDAQLLQPAEAIMRSSVLITALTEAELDPETDEDSAAQVLAGQCGQLTIGVRSGLDSAEELLEEVYDCQPADLITDEEDELVEALVNGQIDAALMSSSHPGKLDHALIELSDSRRAFVHDQYVPVVADRIAEHTPEVVDEISAALEDDALITLRRLIHGEQGLEPEEAAQYWLVENEFIAEPEVWG